MMETPWWKSPEYNTTGVGARENRDSGSQRETTTPHKRRPAATPILDERGSLSQQIESYSDAKLTESGAGFSAPRFHRFGIQL